MAVTFDQVHYQNHPINDFVALINNGEYNSIKWRENGINSCKYMVTHAESFKIFQSLVELLNQEYELDLQFMQVDENNFNEIRWIEKFDLTRLNQFDDFRNLIDDDVKISIIIDNNYHLDGHLEISIAMTFDDDRMIIFDKWSPQNAKFCFNEVNIQVDPGYDNFVDRNNLIYSIASVVFNDIRLSLQILKTFLRTAQNFEINRNILKAVYLDIKDRNRSLTNLVLLKENRKKIKEDIDYVNRNYRANANALSYVDFIRVICIPQPEFRYNKKIEFELTASRAYKTLINMTQEFSEDNHIACYNFM